MKNTKKKIKQPTTIHACAMRSLDNAVTAAPTRRAKKLSGRDSALLWSMIQSPPKPSARLKSAVRRFQDEV